MDPYLVLSNDRYYFIHDLVDTPEGKVVVYTSISNSESFVKFLKDFDYEVVDKDSCFKTTTDYCIVLEKISGSAFRVLTAMGYTEVIPYHRIVSNISLETFVNSLFQCNSCILTKNDHLVKLEENVLYVTSKDGVSFSECKFKIFNSCIIGNNKQIPLTYFRKSLEYLIPFEDFKKILYKNRI